jgi:hypothetical protein
MLLSRHTRRHEFIALSSSARHRPEEQLHERHDASDFETKSQDKIGART